MPTADAPSVPTQDPSRDMVFGAPIAFSVNPASTFSLTLFFLHHANGHHRSKALAANALPIAPRIDLPPKAVYNGTFIIPQAAPWRCCPAAAAAAAAARLPSPSPLPRSG